MKLRKKTLKYKTGGKVKEEGSKVKKKPKTVVIQKAGVTAEGDKMPKVVKDPQLSEGLRNRGEEVKDTNTNVKGANVKIAAVTGQYRALSPEDRKGAKGKQLMNQLRILKDSKRGTAKKQGYTKQNSKGEYYI